MLSHFYKGLWCVTMLVKIYLVINICEVKVRRVLTAIGSNLQAMEFSETLRSYRQNGYLREVTHKQACGLFNSMVEFLDSKSKNPAATLYFSHDGTLLKLLAHLGLFKNEKLLYTDINKNYNWRISRIGTFASNIAFVLHQCSARKKVAVFFNEHLIQLPNCGDLCDIEHIKNYYKDSINNCDFDQICNNK